MSYKDAFYRIVSKIEDLVVYNEEVGYIKADEIVGKLMKQEGKSARDLNAIFEFLTSGKSLNRYIKDRKMMATYTQMMKDDEYDVQSYVDCSGYDNESSFSTGFSKRFGIPPKQAFLQKDKSKIEDPISIDSKDSKTDSTENIENISEKKFGLPKKVIDRYDEICEYKAMFGLEDLYVELAVYLNEKKGIDLKEAFKTVDNFMMDYYFDIEGEHLDTIEELLEYINDVVPVLYVKHLYPDYCLPELNTLNMYLREEGGDASEVTQEFLKVFLDNVAEGLSYKELKALYEEFLNNYKDSYDFREFVEIMQIYGSVDNYDQFMDDLARDLKNSPDGIII